MHNDEELGFVHDGRSVGRQEWEEGIRAGRGDAEDVGGDGDGRRSFRGRSLLQQGVDEELKLGVL